MTMLVERLTGQAVKVGKTSLTIQDIETRKTKGVIRNIKLWQDIPFRDQADMCRQWKSKGINWNTVLNIGGERLFNHEGQWHWLVNTQTMDIFGQDAAFITKLETMKNAGVAVIITH